MLNGGSGYVDVPSVYIVDNRTNGGTGATAVASIFNGRITDINVTNFGSGYSSDNPPTIIIQEPAQAEAAVKICDNKVSGFLINTPGSGYNKAQFVNIARAASGITSYTEEGNAVFSNETTAEAHSADAKIECLDSLFLKQLLEKLSLIHI